MKFSPRVLRFFANPQGEECCEIVIFEKAGLTHLGKFKLSLPFELRRSCNRGQYVWWNRCTFEIQPVPSRYDLHGKRTCLSEDMDLPRVSFERTAAQR